jgi:molybdate transport system permease protein
MYESFWSPIKLSIEIATVASVLVVLLGTLNGRLMARSRFRGKSVVETILMLPLVLPPSVVGFGLIVVFGIQSPIGRVIEWLFQQPIIFTWWAAVIASTVVAFPLMYQSAKTGFQSVNSTIEGAARMDGASERRVFFYITLPLSFHSIISGSILSFARAFGEFGATLMFAGNIPGVTQTIPTAIYIAVDSGDMEMAWLWVGSMIIISFLLLQVIYRKSSQ